jgi:hypothetical protein
MKNVIDCKQMSCELVRTLKCLRDNLGSYMSRKPGTDVRIFKLFSQSILAKKLALLTQNKAKLCKNLIITIFF